MTTAALTDEQKFLLRSYDPALAKVRLDQHLDNLTDDLRTRQGSIAAGTPTAETGGPPDYIDVTLTVTDADGNAVTSQYNVRVRLFDDATFDTVSTVGSQRLTTDGATGVIHVDDVVDAVYRTNAAGQVVVRVEDVGGGANATFYGLVTDGGNENVRLSGTTFSVTFD